VKYCNTCKQTLELSEFSKVHGTERPRSRCKKCAAKRAKAYRTNKKAGIKSTYVISPVIKDPKNHTQQCKKCKNTKPLSEFHKRRSGNRLACWSKSCKVCDAAKQRDMRAKGYKRPSSLSLSARLISIKHRTSKNGMMSKKYGKPIIMDIVKSDIDKLIGRQTINGKLYCAATNIILIDSPGHPLRPSLDRIDSNIGYTNSNIRIVSLMYNLAKGKLNDVDFIQKLNDKPDAFDPQELAKKMLSRKKRSNLRNRKIEITTDDLVHHFETQRDGQYFKCAATGFGLVSTPGHPLYPSIDRINNADDYTPNNIQIVIKAFNLGRNIADSDVAKTSWESIANIELAPKRRPIGLRPKNCEIKMITSREANKLYSKHHYIGKCQAKFNFGVFYENRLIACMSIRKPTRQNAGDWEINRMVGDPDYRVHGIWSKLISEIKTRKLISGKLISYSDNRYFSGMVYQKMGFKFGHDVAPDYFYCKDGVNFHKSRMRKTEVEKKTGKTEWKLREEQGYVRIYDQGKKKWVLHII